MIDLTGQRFGRLTAIERAENNKRGQARWKCACDCGSEKVVNSDDLRSGRTKSCGCSRVKDLTGLRFGKLTVIELADYKKGNGAFWICKCDCENENIIHGVRLINGSIKSCGCCKVIDLTGQRFGRWTVIERAGVNKNGKYLWKIKCDCGNEKVISTGDLQSNRTNSCGCLHRELIKEEYGKATFNTLLRIYKQNAKKRNQQFFLTKDEFKELIFSNCYYCGKKPLQIVRNEYSNGDTVYNGIDRIDSSKGYIPVNVRSCCGQCNIAKSGYSEEEFLSGIKAIYENLNLDQMPYNK